MALSGNKADLVDSRKVPTEVGGCFFLRFNSLSCSILNKIATLFDVVNENGVDLKEIVVRFNFSKVDFLCLRN